MNKNLKAVFTASLVALTAACSDGAFEPVAADLRPLMDLDQAGPSYMDNYVAMGTSLSMGWTSDGVHSGSQATSWTAQFAKRLHAPWSFPGIQAPGCKPPLAAPLGSFMRIDGSPSYGPNTTCAPNEAGVTLPTQNLAVENATAREGFTGTEAPLTGRVAVTSRVLPAGMTQTSAMLSLNPSFVSVEFGPNEVLSAQVGVLAPGLTFTPFSVFQPNYAGIIEAVKSTGARALLVSLGTDVRNFPAIRTGPELAAQREAFARYGVTVLPDCDASPNFMFVRGIVPTAILTAKMAGAATISCTDRPGTVDYILSPNDIAYINNLVAQMDAEILRHAAENGYATFPLGVLYEISKDGVPFDLDSYLTSPMPYGDLISLDGVHPSEKGAALLARAAAKAVRTTYGQNGDGPGQD